MNLELKLQNDLQKKLRASLLLCFHEHIARISN